MPFFASEPPENVTYVTPNPFREAKAKAWAEGHVGCICACHTFSDKACRDCINPYALEQS